MPQNKKQIIEERRQKIAALYLKGAPQFQIAKEVEVTQAQVSKDLKVLTARWRESSLIDINEAKMKELAKIDQLEQEYWTAWEKSKEDYQQTMKKAKGTTEKVNYQEKVVKEMIVYGDPRFLQGIQWCIDKRCKIFGVEAPKQIENKIVDEFYGKTDEELENMANGTT